MSTRVRFLSVLVLYDAFALLFARNERATTAHRTLSIRGGGLGGGVGWREKGALTRVLRAYLVRLLLVVADGGERSPHGRLRLGARPVRVGGLHVVELLVLLVLPVQRRPVLVLRPRLLQRPVVRLTVVQAPVPADLHLAPDVHAERVRELERVEERVRDHRRPFVRRARLQEPTDHLRPEHAPLVVRQLYDVAAAVGRGARFYPHVELACVRSFPFRYTSSHAGRKAKRGRARWPQGVGFLYFHPQNTPLRPIA